MQEESLNTGKVVDFNSIKNFEQAARDFSEGNKELEQLLLDCFNNSIMTTACCAGHVERGQKPYISFKLNELNKKYYDNLLLQLSESGYEFRYIKVENNQSHIQIEENEYFDFSSPSLLFQRITEIIKKTDLGIDYSVQLPRDLQEYSKLIDFCEKDPFLKGPIESIQMQMVYIKNGDNYEYAFFTSDPYYVSTIKQEGFQKPNDYWMSPYQIITQNRENVTRSLKRIREEVQLFVKSEDGDASEIYVPPGTNVGSVAQQLLQLKSQGIPAKATINDIVLSNLDSMNQEQMILRYKKMLEQKRIEKGVANPSDTKQNPLNENNNKELLLYLQHQKDLLLHNCQLEPPKNGKKAK